MHPLIRAALITFCLAVLAPAARAAGIPKPFELPLAEATEWTVHVFGTRMPSRSEAAETDFTVRVQWTSTGEPGGQELSGKVAYLGHVELALSLPEGCTSLLVSLDWSDPGADLDMGLRCGSPAMRMCPLFTTRRPETVRLDAQTAPLYQWLAEEHPGWWRGYPFWAEVARAPKPSPQ